MKKLSSSAIFAFYLLYGLSSAFAQQHQIYKGPEIVGPGYDEQIYDLTWSGKKINGVIKPLAFAKGEICSFEGTNDSEGKMNFIIRDSASAIVARGASIKQLGKNDRGQTEITWLSQIDFEGKLRSKGHSEDQQIFRYSVPFTDIQLMHPTKVDGPIYMGQLGCYVSKQNLKNAEKLIKSDPELKIERIESKDDKKGWASGPNLETNQWRMFHVHAIDCDPWMKIVLLRKSGFFEVVDMIHGDAGADCEDIAEIKSNLICEEDKVSQEKIKACLAKGLEKFQKTHASDVFQPQIRAIKINKFSGKITLQGQASSISGSKSKALYLIDYSFVVGKTESTPSGSHAITISYVDGKWADPPFGGNQFPADKWFKDDINEEECVRASGILTKCIAEASGGKVKYSSISPFFANHGNEEQ
ncbi:hypothetical protein [Luteolibacter sp. LG18]|uniref:hypothetical protein n=1 Tax=Luteolibacter sp. LG18 TaxID=2819286 RepID=UPI002B2BCFC3|nr:hypothetical protein llg_28500 [Luteolibacter sp. LG18]